MVALDFLNFFAAAHMLTSLAKAIASSTMCWGVRSLEYSRRGGGVVVDILRRCGDESSSSPVGSKSGSLASSSSPCCVVDWPLVVLNILDQNKEENQQES